MAVDATPRFSHPLYTVRSHNLQELNRRKFRSRTITWIRHCHRVQQSTSLESRIFAESVGTIVDGCQAQILQHGDGGRSSSRALRKGRPFCMSQLRIGLRSLSCCYGHKTKWPLEHIDIFLYFFNNFRIAQYCVVESSGEEWRSISDKKRRKAHQSEHAPKRDRDDFNSHASGTCHISCYTSWCFR